MTTSIVPSLPDSQELAPLISRLPLWQRRIIALVQSGVDRYRAAAQFHVSPDSVQKAAINNHVFAQALLNAEAGVAVLGAEHARELALSHAGAMIEDSVTASRSEDVKPRDQLSNRRLVLETTGLIGRPVESNNEREKALDVLVAMRRLALEERRAKEGKVVVDSEARVLPREGTGTASKDVQPAPAPPRGQNDALEEKDKGEGSQ